jgi:hypothetical protein
MSKIAYQIKGVYKKVSENLKIHVFKSAIRIILNLVCAFCCSDGGCGVDLGDRRAKHNRHGGAGVGGRQAVAAGESHVLGLPGGVRRLDLRHAVAGGVLRRPHVRRHGVRPLVRRQLLVHARAARPAGRHGQVLGRLRSHSARPGRRQPPRTTNCR